MRSATFIFAALLVATTASAQTPNLKAGLQGLDFLVGHWTTPTQGKVADTGGSSTGEVNFTPEVGGSVLLRKDHVSLYDAAGKPTGAFDIIMMIYPEAGGIRADYADGDHIIHYTSASVHPGRAVTFVSASSATTPTFKLSYVLSKPNVIDIAFSMAPPGSRDFHPIATGSATKGD
jgi:hypothetical protein